jgi:ubiquitin carboxyl-terminal hydrolase 25
MTLTYFEDVEQEIKNKQTMISSQFADSRRLAYRLYAVFMHQGSVEFGHYYIYIYDFSRDVWRKYNDNQVTEVHNRAEILENEGRQNPPTPYFLVYINDTMKDRLVDPVCRDIMNTTSGPTSGEVQTIAETQIAMDDAPPMTSVRDVDMQLIPDEEEWTDSLPAGMNVDSNPENPEAGARPNGNPANDTSTNNFIADRDEVQW